MSSVIVFIVDILRYSDLMELSDSTSMLIKNQQKTVEINCQAKIV